MSSDVDPSHGILRSKSTYDVDDLAWIIGRLSFAIQKGSQSVKSFAAKMPPAFYESIRSLGGVQLSAPHGKNGAMAGKYGKGLPYVDYYHPVNTASPSMAGKLAVPAEEIMWNGSGWELTTDRFVTGGSVHLANELNWLGPHLGSIPFQEIEQ